MEASPVGIVYRKKLLDIWKRKHFCERNDVIGISYNQERSGEFLWTMRVQTIFLLGSMQLVYKWKCAEFGDVKVRKNEIYSFKFFYWIIGAKRTIPSLSIAFFIEESRFIFCRYWIPCFKWLHFWMEFQILVSYFYN